MGEPAARNQNPDEPVIPKAPIRKVDDDASIIVKTMEALKSQEKVKIMIPSSETEKDPVTVSINGYVYQIQRDQTVEVPKDVYRVLLDAKTTTYVQRKREDGEGNDLVPSTSLRFPVSRL
jgi:hypothetical protein